MGIVFARSADKHDIANGDAMYAIQNAIYRSDETGGDPSVQQRQRMVFVGPQHAQTDRLIEVLVERRGRDFVVFHVMQLGAHYRNQMEGRP